MIYGPLNGEMQAYVYDSRNRLTEAGQVQYEYNSENMRTAVTVDGKTTNYVINPHAALSQVLMETDKEGQAQAYYVYGLGLIGREDASGTYQTYHYDRRGSTVALTDVNGQVTDTYAYGPYGEALAHKGTTEQPFQYNGRDGVMKDANGLYHMRARYYNPDIKRFINRDVLRGMLNVAQTLNRYAYVNGNPISYVDPFGLSRDGDSIWIQGGDFLVDSLPYIGTLKGFQQAFSGVNQVTGTKLSTSERWSEGIGSALSFIPIPGMKHVGKHGAEGAVSLWKKLDLQFFTAKGTGEYTKVGGHHVHAKSAFKENVNYDLKKGFSISQSFMKDNGLNHQQMTNKQRELFKELNESGRPNTLQEHTLIGVEALVAGGATRQEARDLVAASLKNLRQQGVKEPSNIPWYK
ncbi:RHS repeat-associated core domain-containing protein [Sporosarcina limicola]|uniref:RHS repeat-associated protein n=1 Tax=Sporosarcina limicola TaxID=34101 RepID=A0A927MMC3_9BACL|nr:RHS repeat-associated core domain-containing protein [Sporosarcina limicola]MBE1556975.1 RHS repeat-associated protein [Sporosarcina limicola]